MLISYSFVFDIENKYNKIFVDETVIEYVVMFSKWLVPQLVLPSSGDVS